MKKLFILFIAVVGFGVSSYAFPPDNVTADASAKIVAAITLTNDVPLNFGSILPDVDGGSVTQAADNSVKATGNNGVIASGASSAAHFNVSAGEGTTYAITYDATATLTSGAKTMLATLSLSAGAASTGNLATVTEFYIGGELAVGTAAAQTAGNYSGTFSVSVAYD